ncbi:mitomycin antibiotic biosynthesis protein [Paenibacillus sp. LMG 31460]|uniref:Mitomycin antibiotic biosynthesis protein n=1 Tax=Paenibacillus germinis TaxID=2654979 RepID=A0ABX1Z5Y2_9BACL|nr:phytanoyl-CoA dioxygenase family protein [Paenibacillus germinis]NOU88691.1 mitomycin antibiotic biosynthesis protein [Paenibacillus germinis]
MSLTVEQIEQFHRDGYVIAENVLKESDLAPIITAIEELIEQRADKLYAEGKIADKHEGESYQTRYEGIYRQSKEIGVGLDIMHWRHPALFEFLKNENLLNVVESLIGGEIACNPIQHLRAKMPYDGNQADSFQNVPWHQDAGVTLEEADPCEIITFWLPLVDAVAETGCMEIIPGAFMMGLLPHHAAGGTTIIPEYMPNLKAKLAPCPKGGIVIMNKYTPHKGTPNVSNIVRWTLDLRYQRTGEPTGRPFHPSFVARSRSNPGSVLTDYNAWSNQWEEAIAQSEGKKIHRV